MAVVTQLIQPKLLASIEELLAAHDADALTALLRAFEPKSFILADVVEVLRLLRSRRQFASLEAAASTFIDFDFLQPIVYRYRAQALIELGAVARAIRVLTAVNHELADEHEEKLEILGLLGRAHKQQFIEHGEPANLQKSVDFYATGWNSGKPDARWHGVNLLALQLLAERRGIELSTAFSATELATQIITSVSQMSSPHIWDYGTAMEASIALGDDDVTRQWAARYVAPKRAQAFELGSTLRQLREVWGSEHYPIVRELDGILQAVIAKTQGAIMPIRAPAADAETAFEAVLGDEGATKLAFLRNLCGCAASVGKVVNSATNSGSGTGFLVKGSALHLPWGDELVFVTNAHVLSSDSDAWRNSIRPENASVLFANAPQPFTTGIGEELFYSDHRLLDVSVYRLDSVGDLTALRLGACEPWVDPRGGAQAERVFVMGHPLGGDAAVSLYDNSLIGYIEPNYVHYRCPTEPGSSGSPVLDGDLTVFALHHGRSRASEANEGVRFLRIREAIAEEFADSFA